MPTFFHKPENALKRASEFIEVGKEESALEVLNDIIRSRKHRHKWTAVHETIMLQYTSLCVKLQRSLFAKDGLYQYRNICKEVAPHSFEKVVNKFLALAEDTAGKARQQSEATALQEVEDLDVVMTPESLLLSTVSGEGAKERTDRVMLTPWVKFLWESYRNMLELLKNNPASLGVYTEVAKKAFDFCLNYQRRTEYRKLCEILRNHLIQAEKYQAQAHSLKLDVPENIQCLVDIRFKQLESSITVDLWQEAFRAIEEIHKLLSISGKAPKASLLENFYSRQAKVYMMAKNQLFHAAALHKLFVLRKEQKKTLTKEEEQITASQVLLATLCIPIEPVPSETDRFLEVDDNSRDKAERLAKLLRMNTPPTRASLMNDMLKHNVLGLLPEKLRQLYQHLEVDFNPLHLCGHVIPILENLEEQEHCKHYVDLLKQVMLVRLIKQVSQVYESIELSRLVELAPVTTTTELEKIVVETASSNNIQVRIDHRTRSLCFGTDLSLSFKRDAPEGPHVQSMPSEILCNQLTSMTHALQQAVRIISAPDIRVEQLDATKRTYQDYQVHCRGDHRRAVQRPLDIEARKEYIESRNKEKQMMVENEKRKKEEKERQDEKTRLEREAKARETERRRQELEEMQLKIKQEKVDALKNTAVGKRAFADITNEELKNMDAELIFSRQLKQIEKEKRDKEIKLKTQEKKVDYFERAKRLEEIPLLEKQYEDQRESDHKFHEDQEEQRVNTAVKEHEEAVDASERLDVMREDADKFKHSLQQRRRKQLEEDMAGFQKKMDEVKAERLAKRRKERIQRRKMEDAEARKEEAARLAQQKREEEERRREEEKRKREAEREEQLQLQQRREREIEEKMKQREEKMLAEMEERKTRRPPRGEEVDRDWRGGTEREGGKDSTASPGVYRPPGRGGGMRGGRNLDDSEPSWRDKRQDGWRGREDGAKQEERWRREGDEERDRPSGGSWRAGGRFDSDRSPRTGYDGDRRRDDDEGGRWGGYDRRDRDRRPPGRDDRREFGRDDRGQGGRYGGRDDRGPSGRFGRDDRGYGRDRGGYREDRGGFDRGRDDRGGYDRDDRGFDRGRDERGYDRGREDRDRGRGWRDDDRRDRGGGYRDDRGGFERFERGRDDRGGFERSNFDKDDRGFDRGRDERGYDRGREDRERGREDRDRGRDDRDRGREDRDKGKGWRDDDRRDDRSGGDRWRDSGRLRADDERWRKDGDRSPGRGDRRYNDRSPGRGEGGRYDSSPRRDRDRYESSPRQGRKYDSSPGVKRRDASPRHGEPDDDGFVEVRRR